MNWSLLYLISEWTIRLVMLVYVPQKRSAAAARTWLLLIFFLPWPGLAVYAMFGRIYVSRKLREQQARASSRIRAAQAELGVFNFGAPKIPANSAAIPILAAKLGDFVPFAGNHIEIITGYDATIDRLVTDIEAARHHVHLLYYIFGDDKYGRRVADALAAAAKRGVACRVLMDAVGSSRALARLAPRMRAQGIEVIAALKVGFFRHNSARFDLRNHRKIGVIDGTIGHTGSENIVNPNFVKGYPNEELNVRITGPVVAQLQAVFLADHFFESGAPPNLDKLFPETAPCGGAVAQVVPSGPGYQREVSQELMVTLLYLARKRVVITTPYFVPDEPFFQAVRSAVSRGVEVSLVLSQHANQLVTQLAQRSYYEGLLAAGVAIHLYQPHFLHAKHLSIDDEIVLIGSTNIDIRSFALNAESNILIYDPAIALELRAIQERYFAASHRVTAEEWSRRPRLARIAQNVARLADSLL